jgi:hypothetical protein
MASLSIIGSAKLAKLLTQADPTKSMYVRVLSSNRLALGTDPLKPTLVVDLSREAITPFAESKISEGSGAGNTLESSPDLREGVTLRGTRRSGDYWFEIKGRRANCHSLKELLANALLAIERATPGTLEKLSHVKPRSRRIVSRDPRLLFDKPHLARDYAERLGTIGWFYGTNNSANETNAWLQRACEIAGLKWHEQFKTSLAPSTADLLAGI